jgi:hypothetical protein
VTGAGLAFPLVPRYRLLGLAFGAMHSARRGLGSDVAGTRPYRPTDDMNAIDWAASARLSAAHDQDEFIVRERFADEAPRVVALCDRRPAMTLFPPGLPWLAKPRAMRVALRMIASSAFRARGLFGYLDVGDSEEPYWIAPQSEPHWYRLEQDFEERPWEAPADNLARGFGFFRLARLSLPPGTFVFVLSDFLVSPPAEEWFGIIEHRWDVVPVIIQDPTWEQTFPDVSGVAVPVLDAETGKIGTVRLTRKRARELRRAREDRLEGILRDFTALGVEPVVISSTDDETVLRSFLSWVDRRLYLQQAWPQVA